MTIRFHHISKWTEFLLFLLFQILLILLELLLLLLLCLLLLRSHKVIHLSLCILTEESGVLSRSTWSTRHLLLSLWLLKLIFFSHCHLSLSFLTALLSLTYILFRYFCDWLIRDILLHALWHHITLWIIFNVSILNIDDRIYNLLMTIALAKIRIWICSGILSSGVLFLQKLLLLFSILFYFQLLLQCCCFLLVRFTYLC